jgi:amino-acid N-acetyltransferase
VERISVLDVPDLDAMLKPDALAETGLSSPDRELLGEIREMLSGGLPAVNLCSLEGLADDLFTYAGSGTFFARERYAHVRRLALDDFDSAADLVARGVDEGYLVARGEAELERVLAGGFGVFIEGRYLAGIGSLIAYPKAGAGEIASLYTLTRFIGEGVGSHLMHFALERAAEEGFDYVFACTTSDRVERFFVRHGFRPVEIDDVPASKWSTYSEARRASIRCLRIEV